MHEVQGFYKVYSSLRFLKVDNCVVVCWSSGVTLYALKERYIHTKILYTLKRQYLLRKNLHPYKDYT